MVRCSLGLATAQGASKTEIAVYICTAYLAACSCIPREHSRRRQEAHASAGPAPAAHGGRKDVQRVIRVEGMLKGLEAQAHLQGQRRHTAASQGECTFLQGRWGQQGWLAPPQ